MTIRVTRNAEGNCINFVGSSQPAYWNACLSAAINSDNPNLINVINDIRSTSDVDPQIEYEFYAVPFTDFSDRDGNAFATPADCVAYINDKANVLGVSDTGSDLSEISVDFRLDQTSTSIIMDNGAAYGVNTIKAVSDADGTIHIHAIGAGVPDGTDEPNDHKFYEKLIHTNVSINGVAVPGGLNDVTNALNELFTVGPFEAVVISDPFSTLVADVGGEIAGFTLEGNTATDPIGSDVFTNSTNGNYAGLKSVATISKPGEYFTFDIRGESQIGFGLVHSDASFADGKFRGNSAYADPATFAATASAHSGFQFSHWFHPTPNGSWTNYGASTGYVTGPGWGNWDKRQDWLDGNPVKMRVGIDELGFIAISSQSDTAGEWIMHARTSYTVLEGAEFHLGVKAANGLGRVASEPYVHLLAEDDTPTVIGDTNITTFGSATGTLAGGVTVTASSGNNHGFVTTESINAAGQYFEFTVNNDEDHLIGLFSENDYNVGDMVADTDPWLAREYFFFGSKINTDEQYEDFVYSEASGNAIGDTTLQRPTGCTHYRVGFDTQGRATLWSSTDGTNFVASHHHISAAPSGEYKLLWKAGTNGATFESVTTGALTLVPTLQFRFIESPDGYYSYPLFATQEEADYYELVTAGANNGSHTHVYPDDPTFTTWYMPNTAHQMNFGLTPIEDGVTQFMGNPIVWTEITSLTNVDLAPPTFGTQAQSLNENVAANIQVHPQDAGFTTTVSGLPDGLTYNAVGGVITGTTPYVPTDTTYQVVVTRTNTYGSSDGALELTIIDNASIGDITGFTEVAGNMVQPSTIFTTHDALLQYDTVLSQGEEMSFTLASGMVPSIGVLSTNGKDRVNDFDPATDVLGAPAGSAGYDFAEAEKWDVRFTLFSGSVGSNAANSALTGWTDNTPITGGPGANMSSEFTLRYELDTQHGSNYHLVLYRDGVELLRSNDHYFGDQTISFASFDDQLEPSLQIPADLSIQNSAFGTTTPPSGFTDPLLAGEMATSTVFGTGSNGAVMLTEKLKINHRYIVPRAWIETNVLPRIAGGAASSSNDKQFLFGVPKAGVNWATVDVNHFHAVFRLEGSSSNHVSRFFYDNTSSNGVAVGSTTDAFYDYAIEWDGTDLHLIACNIGDINTQPGISVGGAFSRTATFTNFVSEGFANQDLDLVIAIRNGAEVDLSTSGLQQIRTPFGAKDFLIGEYSNGHPRYSTLQPSATLYDDIPNGHAWTGADWQAPTLAAGETYRLIFHPSLESTDDVKVIRTDDGSDYMDNVTAFGSGDPVQYGNGYKGFTFAVPIDAPPIKLAYKNSFGGNTSYNSLTELPISGSTYVVPITDITIEGPMDNFDGNTIETGSDGWISLDEQLSAGERLVLDSAFLQDLNDALPDFCIFWVGLKDDAWSNTGGPLSAFKGGTALRFYNTSGDSNLNNEPGLRMLGYANNGLTSQLYTASLANASAFIEITSSGNNIRVGFEATSSGNDAATTPYADWESTTKIQTGDQGYGITSRDVVIYWQAIGNNSEGFDLTQVNWQGLSEIAVPVPAPSTLTPWTKALDFSGSSERAQQVASGNSYTPVNMGGITRSVPLNSAFGATHTSNDSYARPWATAIVFNLDFNPSNQHIWNLGEGTGDSDDNIYLRVDAQRQLYFGWGRSGALNELRLTADIGTAHWYGVYIASNGTRLGGSQATASNLANCFDIRFGGSHNSWFMSDNLSTGANWSSNATSIGGRMDRSFAGDFTIGGRGANRSFHGKVASMVVTTLVRNVPMPDAAEIELMVTDPIKWMNENKNGPAARYTQGNNNFTTSLASGSYNNSLTSRATQVWLMGDGTNDSYSNMIRNQVMPSDQNYTKLNLISMTSSDIQNVNIPGLT